MWVADLEEDARDLKLLKPYRFHFLGIGNSCQRFISRCEG